MYIRTNFFPWVSVTPILMASHPRVPLSPPPPDRHLVLMLSIITHNAGSWHSPEQVSDGPSHGGSLTLTGVTIHVDHDFADVVF